MHGAPGRWSSSWECVRILPSGFNRKGRSRVDQSTKISTMDQMVSDGNLVKIHYRLSLADGTVVDDTSEGEPVVYVHGKGELVPGLERGLAGLKAEDKHRISVEPADGYGPRDPSAEQSVPREQFPAGVELSAGMSFQASGDDGAVPVWVESVEGDTVTITSNHPLAGQSLIYDVQVLEVREATVAEQTSPDT